MNENKDENLNLDLDTDDLFKINDNFTILLNKKIGSFIFWTNISMFKLKNK